MKSILIIDDAPENLRVLSGILEPHYTVRAARSGERGLEIARGDPLPDLVLLDGMMPGMDGFAVLQRLRGDPRTVAIPVIFVTALQSTGDEERGLALGAVDYIQKPVQPAAVLARVKTHLELKAARDQLRARNVALEAEVEARMRENVLVQDATIRALAELAEMRDSETGNHIKRTQEYVALLGNALKEHPRFRSGLADGCLRLLVKSAPLHDIGKVGIPDHVLLKPDKLTPAEWEIMKGHAALGAEALARAERDVAEPLDFLRVAKEIARHHHERWDGSGYPDGLAGEAIPVSARLMALADVFDALISRRVYKAPYPLARAVEIVLQGKGSHFDPAVVDAFMALRSEFERVAERYADSEADCRAKVEALRLPYAASPSL
ncbi:MAG: two-component system response regulator [Polyangiaceae bacterium]